MPQATHHATSALRSTTHSASRAASLPHASLPKVALLPSRLRLVTRMSGTVIPLMMPLTMALMAVAIGYGLHATETMTGRDAAITSAVLLAFMLVHHGIAALSRRRNTAASKLNDLSRGVGTLANQVTHIGRRLAANEQQAGVLDSDARTHRDNITAEISELGALVQQLALAMNHTMNRDINHTMNVEMPPQPASAMATPQRHRDMAPDTTPGRQASSPISAEMLGHPRSVAAQPATTDHSPAAPYPPDLRATLLQMMEHKNLKFIPAPIETHPQGKAQHQCGAYYEIILRLPGFDISPADLRAWMDQDFAFAPLAIAVLRAALNEQAQRAATETGAILFCPLPGVMLAQEAQFSAFCAMLQTAPAAAPLPVLQISQACFRALPPAGKTHLAKLSAMGFRFALGDVTDLNIFPPTLAGCGFSFVRLLPPVIGNRPQSSPDIDPADFADLLARSGMELVVENAIDDHSSPQQRQPAMRYG